LKAVDGFFKGSELETARPVPLFKVDFMMAHKLLPNKIDFRVLADLTLAKEAQEELRKSPMDLMLVKPLKQ